MRVTLNIEYTAEADREGETAKHEQVALDAIEAAAEEFVGAITRNARAEGLEVNISRR